MEKRLVLISCRMWHTVGMTKVKDADERALRRGPRPRYSSKIITDHHKKCKNNYLGHPGKCFDSVREHANANAMLAK